LKYNPDLENELSALLDAKMCLGSAQSENIRCDFNKLIKLSMASGTWAKYNSGWRSFKNYVECTNSTLSWPIPIHVIRSYVVWCISDQKISSATVKSYLSSIAMAHALKGLQYTSFMKDKVVELLLTGAENYSNLQKPKQTIRRAMSLSTLLIIGHKLAKSDWSVYNRQVIWAACTTAFFTSVRMGEILSDKVFSFDENATLLWKDVKEMSNNEILLFIPSTKTSKCKGEFLDIFPLNSKHLCPVSALKQLMKQALTKGCFDMNKPVFSFDNGKNLTTQKLNSILKTVLADIFEPGKNVISCHSFRAAIPTVLNSHPELFTHTEIKLWGRWVSDSYLDYLRLHRENRRNLFNRLVNVLL
jgi:hypothetical protein